MTKEEAVAKFDTEWWEAATNEQIVAFQLYESRLCVPFDRFHEAIEAVLERPVFTHEFADTERLVQEHQGLRDKGTLEKSMQLLKELAGDKPIIVVEVGG